jgi:hypothetical protein
MFGSHAHEPPGAPRARDTVVDIEKGLSSPPWREAQAAIDEVFARLEGVDAPPDYCYASLIRYLSDPAAAPTDSARAEGDFAALMACRSDPARAATPRRVARLLAEAAGGAPIYLADQHAYVREALPGEFPELRVFDIEIDDAFAQTETPGIWVETARFADLRSLSRMRREIRRTGLRCAGQDPVKLIAVLLGFAQPSR